MAALAPAAQVSGPPAPPLEQRLLESFAKGEQVLMWSSGHGAWLPGLVEERIDTAHAIEGYSFPSGCLWVSSAAGMNWVSADQVSTRLRKICGGRTSAGNSGQAPTCGVQRLSKLPSIAKGERVRVWDEGGGCWSDGVVEEVVAAGPDEMDSGGFPSELVQVRMDDGTTWVDAEQLAPPRACGGDEENVPPRRVLPPKQSRYKWLPWHDWPFQCCAPEERGNCASVTVISVMEKSGGTVSEKAAWPSMQPQICLSGENEDKVKACYQEVSHLRQQLGDRHLVTLECIDKLGRMLQEQRRASEAEQLFREAVAGRRSNLGQRHPHTLTSINNLAVFLFTQERSNEAEVLLHQCLAGFRTELGDTHPNTLTSIENLALLLRAKQRFEAAESLFREVLNSRRALFGDKHPEVLRSTCQLVWILQSQDSLFEAEPILRQGLESSRALLGEEHPRTWQFERNLRALHDLLVGDGCSE